MMNRSRRWLGSVIGLGLLTTQGFAGEVPLNGHVFTVPEGFTIELVADSKLAPHPISADFDELVDYVLQFPA